MSARVGCAPKKLGYHIQEIKRGELGEISKIREELDELEDADFQGCRIMCLLELADMLGAMRSYLDKHYSGFTIRDLEVMSETTERAFKSGKRS